MRESPRPTHEQQRRDIAAAVAAYRKRNGPPETDQPNHEINEIIERMKRKEAASARG